MPGHELCRRRICRPRVAGARRLFVFRAIDLAWFVAYSFLLTPALMIRASFGLSLLRGAQIVFLVLAATHVALLGGLAREVGARPAAGPLRLAIGLAGIRLMLSVLRIVARFGGPNLLHPPGELGYVIMLCVFAALYLAMDVALWIAFARLLGSAMTSSLHAAFFALRITDAALSLLGLIFEGPLRKAEVAQLEMWVGAGLTVAWSAVVLVALYRLSQRAPSSEASGAPEPASAPDGKTDILVGGLLLGGGLLVTLASYSSASGGGRYVVTTGAIAVGIVRLVRGLTRVSRGAG